MPTLAEIRQGYPQYEDLSDDQLASALYTKFYRDLPREEFDKRIGYAPAPPTTTAPEAALKGAKQGLTFGFGDEIAGASAASGLPEMMDKVPFVGGPAFRPLVGAGRLLADKITGNEDATKTYREQRDESRKANEVASKEHPIAFGAGEFGGAVGTALVPVGAVARGATGLARFGRGAATGAGYGAVQGAGEAPEIADIPKESAVGAGVGAGVGGLIPALGTAARRAITPFPISAERQALVHALQNEGVDLSAGQMTGNRPLRWMESALGDIPGAGGQAAGLADRQGRQFTAAALRRVGENAELTTPDVMRNASQRIGSEFEALSARNTLRYDQQFAQDIGRVVNEYDRVLPSQQRGVVHAYIQDLSQSPGGLPGTVYQETRSRLTRQFEGLRQSDPMLSGALHGLRNALDNAMDRSISPADAAAWAQARSQWRNMRTVEKAATGAGERTAEGYLSPSQLRTAVAGQGRAAYARGHGDLAELARAGEAIMRPLPQSGTAPRAYAQGIASALSAGAGGAAGGIPGAFAGLAAPAVAGRLLMSAPVQRLLSNQAAAGPPNPTVARLANALLNAPARQQLVNLANDDPARRRRQLATR